MQSPPKVSCHIQNTEALLKKQSEEIISSQEALFKKAPCEKSFYQMETSSGNTIEVPKEILKLKEESLEKVSALLTTQEFQTVIEELRKPQVSSRTSSSVPSAESANLFIFVSFSLGEKALLNLAQEAKRYGATLVLRGFKDGSYRKTVHALQKIIKSGLGFIIDPELYTLFSIQTVPTFILSKPFSLNAEMRNFTPLHDRLQGHVSAQYALEVFAKDGDLKEEALSLLSIREAKE